MKDYLIRGIDKSDRIRILVATTTNMVEQARLNHKASPTATAALGRSLTAGVMMGSMMKNEDDVFTLKIAGNGPGGTIYIVSKNNGRVKGYIDNPHIDVPSTSEGKLDVGALVGNEGTISTIMDLGLKEPYTGQSDIVSGEIAEDLVSYYAYSEQQPSAISLGVLVDKDISVKAAGGYIIQLLPGIPDEDIDKLEATLASIEPVSVMIDEGLTPEDIMHRVLKEFDMRVLEKIDIDYRCDCSRERIEQVIISLGEEEIQAIIEEDGNAEVVCQFCNSKYQFDKEELTKLLLTIEK